MAQPRRHPVRVTFLADSDRMANATSADSRFAGFDWKHLISRTPNLSAGTNKLSLLAGLTAGLVYSSYASFVANTLTPVSGYLIETDPLRRAVSGGYLEVFSLDGAIPTVLASLVVFVLVWWTTRVIVEHWQSEDWGRVDSIDPGLSDVPFLIPLTVAPLAAAVSE